LEPVALNNFSTASIYNELAWAVGKKPYNPADMIIEVQSVKFMDMNVIPKIKPDRFEAVVARWNAIRSAYSTFQSCGLWK
jgi:hypothetical protein